jgi:hypothetical protein
MPITANHVVGTMWLLMLTCTVHNGKSTIYARSTWHTVRLVITLVLLTACLDRTLGSKWVPDASAKARMYVFAKSNNADGRLSVGEHSGPGFLLAQRCGAYFGSRVAIDLQMQELGAKGWFRAWRQLLLLAAKRNREQHGKLKKEIAHCGPHTSCGLDNDWERHELTSAPLLGTCLLTRAVDRGTRERKAKHEGRREAPAPNRASLVDSSSCLQTWSLRQRLHGCVACWKPAENQWVENGCISKRKSKERGAVAETECYWSERLKKFRERGAEAGTRHLLETLAI